MPEQPAPRLAEIKRLCAEIRAGWSEEEERRRRVGSQVPRRAKVSLEDAESDWLPPVVKVGEVEAAG